MTGRLIKAFLCVLFALALGATLTGQYALSTAMCAVGLSVINSWSIKKLEDRHDV